MKPCSQNDRSSIFLMAISSIYLAEEALSLPPQQREQLAKLSMQSLQDDGRSDDEIRTAFRARLTELKSGRDIGMGFEAVFSEPL